MCSATHHSSVSLCRGSSLERLNRPFDVALDSEGNLYIADHGNNRVLRWEPGATAGIKIGGQHLKRRRVGSQRRHTLGGGFKSGGWKTSRMTPIPKRGFGPPLVRYVFHLSQVSVLCFSCTKIHDRADQKLFWRGPKIFGRARSLVRLPPSIHFAPPHITAQNRFTEKAHVGIRKEVFLEGKVSGDI